MRWFIKTQQFDMRYFILLMVSFFSFHFSSVNRKDHCNLNLFVSNMRNDKGAIQVSVFNSAESFVKESPYYEMKFNKKGLNDEMNISIEIPSGIYGIVILDDENLDHRMNYNLIGIPTEGYGFSNYTHKGIARPVFQNFQFILKEPNKNFNIKLRYH